MVKEDIRKLWGKTLVNYDMDVMLGIQHWEKIKRLAYRGKRANTTPRKVYSNLKITFVDEVLVDELFEYGFLKSITVTRADKKSYTFKESDFNRLNLNDIEDMNVLKAQGKLKHLGGDIEYYLVKYLLVYMRSLIIRKRVEDVQLGVESYQNIYEGRNEKKKFIRGDKVYKLCDGTLTDVRDQLVNLLRMNQVGKKYQWLNYKEWSDRDVQRSKVMLKRIEAVDM
nr:hypothetical protein [Tanacetum cinerariifolium]